VHVSAGVASRLMCWFYIKVKVTEMACMGLRPQRLCCGRFEYRKMKKGVDVSLIISKSSGISWHEAE